MMDTNYWDDQDAFYAPPVSQKQSANEKSTQSSSTNAQSALNSTLSSTSTRSQANSDSNSILIVKIANPEKHGEGVDAHVRYELRTQTTIPSFGATELIVRRRFQDFLWLKDELEREYINVVVPPLPDKSKLDYLDRFSQQFIDKRQLGLQRFVDRIVDHPILHRAPVFQRFLEDKPSAFETLKLSKKTKTLDELGDRFMNALSKVKYPDPTFVSMTEYVHKLQEQVILLEKVQQRIIKRQNDLSEDFSSLAAVIKPLSSEDAYGEAFHQVGLVHEKSANVMKDINLHQSEYCNELTDTIHWCNGVLRVLRSRDVQQSELDTLTHELQIAQQKASAVSNKSTTSTSTSNPSNTSYTTPYTSNPEESTEDSNYSSNYYSPSTTSSPESQSTSSSTTTPASSSKGWKIGQNDPQKLAVQVEELQQAVAESSDDLKKFNADVLREMDLFNDYKTKDLKNSLRGYASFQLEHAQMMLNAWQEILPTIEEIKLDS